MPRGLWRFVICLLTAGCSLVPDYHRPSLNVPQAWDGKGDEPTNAVAARGEWWRSFGSSELNMLMQQSLSQNFNLHQAISRITEAQATAQIAGAPQYPALVLAGTQSQVTGVKNTATHTLLAQASYEIDFWGKNRAAADSSKALAQASAFDADTVAMTQSASVVDTYFQILSLSERSQLAEQIAGDARHILSLIEIQTAAGTATELQVEQQRTAVANFDAAVPVLRLQADQARHALAVLTGRPPQGFTFNATDLSGISHPEVAADLPMTLLERRPDIRSAEAQLLSANFNIGIARAAYFPDVSLNAALGIGSKTIASFGPPSVVTGMGASLLQPLFEGGQLEGQLRFDRARQEELVGAYRQAVLVALQDVEDQLSATQRLREQEAVVARGEVAAQKAAALAELQYRLGSADYLTVLTTEQSLYQFQDTLLQLRLLRLQAVVGLIRALGGGFDAASGPAPAPSSGG
jgi:NodT family efflux transporter outer membrane factor (OMF) lipoprotein